MQKTNYIISIIFTVLLFAACKNENGKSIFEPNRVEPPKIENRATPSNDDNIGRSSWQKPEMVLGKLGDIEGKTVADIGAGTGYFVYRLAYKNANVIAIDIDTSMVEFMESFKENLPKKVKNKITTRLGLPGDSKLETNEVDKAIIINTISYIENPEAYLKKLYPAIKPGGQIMILDYKSKSMDIPAPPLVDRLSIGILESYLTNAGYTNITVDDSSLEYQYIILAEVR